MFAIIIFTSMFERDLSRYSQSTPKTRLLTYSPSLWHKMTSNVIVAPCASNLPQATSVTIIRDFGTYLRYLPTSPMSHHCDNIPATPLRNSRISHAPCFAKFNLVKITFRFNKLINFYFTESLRPKISRLVFYGIRGRPLPTISC